MVTDLSLRRRRLLDFDGFASATVFCIWSGDNPMSPEREQALLSIFRQVQTPVLLLDRRNIEDWQHPEAPFHPAYPYLSATHKSDYLRCYLMHHYGGGYTDIKHSSKPWGPLFRALDAHPGHEALGYQEIGPHGVARVGGPLQLEMQQNYQRLIGLCAFIFRRRSALTSEWLAQTHALLDAKLPLLQQHPARHPQDQLGAQFSDGSVSRYPIAWTEMLGNLFHPLVYRWADHILQADIAPSFSNYR